MKINDYLERYILERSEDKSENTLSYYRTDLRQFDDFIGQKDIEEIKNADIEEFKNTLLQDKKLKVKTVNRKLISLRQYIHWINEEYELKKIIKIKALKIQRQEYLDEILEMKDFERLARMADRENDTRALAMMYSLYYTGVRVSELLQFKVSDISNEYITVIGKGKKARDVGIPSKLKVYLKEYIRERNHGLHNFLFLNNMNDNVMSRQSVNNVLRKYAGMARVKLSKAHAHSLRHLSGIRMIEAGLSIDEVADILGHENINTTRIYVRKTKKELFEAMNRL